MKSSDFQSEKDAYAAITAKGNRIYKGASFDAENGSQERWLSGDDAPNPKLRKAIKSLPLRQMSPVYQYGDDFFIVRVLSRADELR